MHIAICDNEKKDIEILTHLINQYTQSTHKEFLISTFQSANQLLSSIEDGNYYNLILCDVLMPETNGIEAVHMIRNHGIDTQIVFTTNSRDFAIDAFAVKANNYLVKPIVGHTLYPILDELEITEQKGVLIETKNGIKKIMPDKLLYAEVKGHTVFWHFTTGSILQSRDSIKTALEIVDGCGEFLQIHRSFFINIAYVLELSHKELSVTLKGNKKLYIPRAKYAEVHTAYIDYVKHEGHYEK